jgi:hypothetical protein
MKTNITHMLRFGRMYSVFLACGHKYRARPTRRRGPALHRQAGPVQGMQKGR